MTKEVKKLFKLVVMEEFKETYRHSCGGTTSSGVRAKDIEICGGEDLTIVGAIAKAYRLDNVTEVVSAREAQISTPVHVVTINL